MPRFEIPHEARAPAELHDIIGAAISARDIDAFLGAHEVDACVIVPPEGRSAYGHDAIRAAITPLFAMQPEMTVVVTKALESGGVALSHARWTLVLVDDGCQSELRGVGTMVSRRHEDGTWRIVLDDPLTAVWEYI